MAGEVVAPRPARPRKKAAAPRKAAKPKAAQTAKKTVAKTPPPPEPAPPREDEVFDPAYVAHRLRMQGHSWAEIAQTTGYASGPVASMAVSAYLQKAAMAMSKERAEEALALEIEMLYDIRRAWYVPATRMGDKDAAKLVLQTDVQMLRLLEHYFTSDQETAASRTVVITGDTADYVNGLRRLVEGDPAPRKPE